MAIKELLVLEGLEEVQSQLDKAQKMGEDFLKNVRDSANISEEGLKNFTDGLKGSGEQLDITRQATHDFSEGLRVAIPILRTAGVEVGNFSGFARLASVGFVGLAAAIGGAVAVALANLEESTKRTRTELEGLFGSKELGDKAFAGLQASANALDTTVGGLVPVFQSAQTALQRFIQTSQGFKFVALQGVDLPAGVAGNIKNTTEAISNLIKIIRAGGQDEATAEKSAKSFFDTMKEGGKLTAEALKNMDPGAVQLLATAMGRGAVSTEQFIAEVSLAPIPINKLLEQLGKFGPGAQQAFDTKAVKSFKDEFQGLINDIQSGFKRVSGFSFSDIIIQFLGDVRKGFKDSGDQIDWFKRKVIEADAAANNIPGIQQLSSALQKVQTAAASIGDTFREALGGAFGGTTEQLKKIWDGLTPPTDLGPKFKFVGDALAESFTSPKIKTVSEELKKTVSDMQTDAGAAAEAASKSFDDAQQVMLTDTGAMVEANTAAKIQIDETWRQSMIDETAKNATTSTFDQMLQDLAARASAGWQQLAQILGQPIPLNISSGFGGQPLGAPFARGGLVRGPGTTTSDSIWARLSDKEFVLNAKATQFYGAELLYALNALRVPRQFPGFSMGGLVNAMANAMPKFATGGMATSGTPVTFVIDTHRFNVTAPTDTVKALSRFSVNRQLSATGRKPSWVK